MQSHSEILQPGNLVERSPRNVETEGLANHPGMGCGQSLSLCSLPFEFSGMVAVSLYPAF